MDSQKSKKNWPKLLKIMQIQWDDITDPNKNMSKTCLKQETLLSRQNIMLQVEQKLYHSDKVTQMIASQRELITVGRSLHSEEIFQDITYFWSRIEIQTIYLAENEKQIQYEAPVYLQINKKSLNI